MSNLDLWNAHKSVPDEYTKKISGGRLSGKTDIRPQWRLMVLTAQFGPCGVGWYYETVERWTDEANSEISAHVRILLYVKNGEEWSKGIEGQGGSMLLAKENKGPYHSDEAWKMATTDAISVACKQLGIGADVYMGEKTKHDKRPQPDHQAEWRRIWLDRVKNLNTDDGHRADLEGKVKRAESQAAAKAIMEEIKAAENAR